LSYRFLNRKNATLQQKFEFTNITEKVKTCMDGIERRISEMLKIIKQPEPPIVEPDKKCFYPYKCPLMDKCGKI